MAKIHLFENLDYETYNKENKISDLFKIDLKQYGEIDSKQIRSTFYSVDPNNKDPFTAELDDLIRLHYLVKKKKSNNSFRVWYWSFILSFISCALSK